MEARLGILEQYNEMPKIYKRAKETPQKTNCDRPDIRYWIPSIGREICFFIHATSIFIILAPLITNLHMLSIHRFFAPRFVFGFPILIYINIYIYILLWVHMVCTYIFLVLCTTFFCGGFFPTSFRCAFTAGSICKGANFIKALFNRA